MVITPIAGSRAFTGRSPKLGLGRWGHRAAMSLARRAGTPLESVAPLHAGRLPYQKIHFKFSLFKLSLRFEQFSRMFSRRFGLATEHSRDFADALVAVEQCHLG